MEIERRENPQPVEITPEVLEALRFSANTQGAPQLAVSSTPVFGLATSSADAVNVSESEWNRIAGMSGELDTLSTAVRRREQGYLRSYLFGNNSTSECSLCGKKFPKGLLVAAHIKKRSQCTEDERRDVHNVVMSACVFGCDSLYEKGYITVASDGIITGVEVALSDLQAAISEISGRICAAHSAESEKYFEWHRNEIFRGK